MGLTLSQILRMRNSVLICLLMVVVVGCKDSLSRKRDSENQKTTQYQDKLDRPKLVVGIVVDQMRYDYLTRFYDRYGSDGFKRLLKGGFDARNNHFNYVPTYTAPGHTSIYTGTTPSNHGIIGNNWYDKTAGKIIYNASDDHVEPVGTNSDDGKMSPRQMLTTTVTDELELHTQGRAKVIGISLKDRGAILPAGHAADAAYWFIGGGEGNFISSTFYLKSLPEWVQDFNASDKVESYLKDWNTLYDVDTYVESGSDVNRYERSPRGMNEAHFPYNLKDLADQNDGLSILKSTPYGNSIVTDFAIEAIENEKMGNDEITDFLAISYSSTDYIGHQYGVNSVEIEDTYLRLDLEIARLLKELDEKVGQGEYSVFLTADHGAVENPTYLFDRRVNSGYFDTSKLKDTLNRLLTTQYKSADLIENISNEQIFLDHEKLKELNVSNSTVQNFLAETLMNIPYVDKVFLREDLMRSSFSAGTGKLISNGFHQKRSGDIAYVLEPAVISYGTKGSTHGSSQTYDTHVPLIFYGKGFKTGYTYKLTEITDIAPTVAAMLRIAMPSGATGNPIEQVLD
jgi:predicted AlkP superfamily pyrophosphatase or phosphodiesterase